MRTKKPTEQELKTAKDEAWIRLRASAAGLSALVADLEVGPENIETITHFYREYCLRVRQNEEARQAYFGIFGLRRRRVTAKRKKKTTGAAIK